MNIKAAILVEQKSQLIIDNIKLKDKLKVGQILVKIHTSGICGSQIGEIDGVKGEDKYLPHLLGHEGCGTIVDCGPEVKKVKSGDRVILHWMKSTGLNSDPPQYYWKGEKLNAGWVTTFNNYAVISENRCTKINSQLSNEVAALFGCAVTTGFGVVENNAKLKIGESVVIFGSGGIGLNMIQAAKMKSAYPIIAVDLHQNRLDLAKSLGATHLVNSKFSNPSHSIKEIIGNNLDIFIDNTGLSSVIEEGYKLINEQGRLILVGVPKVGDQAKIFTLPLHFGKKIIGSYGGECDPDKDIKRYSNLLIKGLFNLEQLITEKYKLEDINIAIKRLRNGLSIGRTIINL